jgi:lysine 2,3-aminomutase
MESLRRVLVLSEEEWKSRSSPAPALPVRITPYYASLLDPADPFHPLRRCVVPVAAERRRSLREREDPLAEEQDSPCAAIVHRYPDRVLFLATGTCAAYCRYCTRSRIVGKHGKSSLGHGHWESAIAYIEATPAVRDVVISGGDPLTLSDEKLEWLLRRLRQIPHVEMLRLGTKVPLVLPQRVTRGLVSMLKRYHPLWMSLHVTHPLEMTPEARNACRRLADAGIPLGSQTVLLAGVNDDVPTLKSLYHELLKVRVRPYYLYQCDPIPGSSHFRTEVSRGLEIIQGLRGHTSGYAVPHYVIDAPGGGGKITLLPNAVTRSDEQGLLLRNYAGKTFCYPARKGFPESVPREAKRRPLGSSVTLRGSPQRHSPMKIAG